MPLDRLSFSGFLLRDRVYFFNNQLYDKVCNPDSVTQLYDDLDSLDGNIAAVSDRFRLASGSSGENPKYFH